MKPPSTLVRLALVFAASANGFGVASAENWPQWRGPENNGISTETGLPTKWSADKNIAWKLPLPGVGSSTPAVWGDRLFLTVDDGPKVTLLAVSVDGKVLWKQPLGPGGRRRSPGGETNSASPSPSTDGVHVWAFAGSGELYCFDMAGTRVWQKDIQKEYGRFNIQFGMHSTPVLYENRLYLQLIHSGGATVVALDKATGKEIWKIKRPSDGTDENEHSYASPLIWHKDKDAYLITHGNDYAVAHSLKDGSEIWRVGELNPRTSYNRTLRFVASPVATPDLIVVPSAKNGPVVAVKPDATGKVYPGSAGELWRMKNGTPDVPSPLVFEGLVYLVDAGNGMLTCLDAKSGEKIYAKRTHDSRYRASPVYADGKIYLTAQDGTVSVVKAGRDFELLATNKLDDEILASPAISGGRIYLHGYKALYAVGKAAAAATGE